MKEKNPLQELFQEEKETKTYAKIFDSQTIKAINSLASKGIIDMLEFVISTGKEAHVFRAMDSAGNFRAVKIYKTATSDFKKMNQYLKGDYRFKNVKKEKRDIVHAWTKKEFKNLERMNKAGTRVPMGLATKENVLVMEFIGNKEGTAAKTLKETPAKEVDYNYTYEKIIEFTARNLYLQELIHADLSEYNILMHEKEPVIIDVGQAVLNTHPMAKEFFERDILNIANYFSKKGINTDYEKAIEDVKKWKGKLLKEKKN
ncbi:MAG: serine protein kinase RIO [Candidatus Diapherotrites archaeon]